MKKFDFVIVGCGLFGSTFANLAKEDGKSCLIIDKRNHIGGNCYTENIDGIEVHKYGPHIFHTNNDEIWSYVNRFTSFNNYTNRPKINHKGKIFSFPINLMTLYQLWGVTNPTEAQNKLESVKIKIDNPSNLEEWILSQVGEEIYYTFIYGYTKKQWNTEPKNLPSFIIKRLPIRLNFDDNYFFDKYQGIPENGYTAMISNMIDGIEVILETDFFDYKDFYESIAHKIVYTGPLDRFYNYQFGQLEYRSLRFDIERKDTSDFQGNAIINYTDFDIEYTRIIEHKHFTNQSSKNSIISKEYPLNWQPGLEPYYPINNERNDQTYVKYQKLSNKDTQYIFGGRLAEYRYYDMHQIIASALVTYNKRKSI